MGNLGKEVEYRHNGVVVGRKHRSDGQPEDQEHVMVRFAGLEEPHRVRHNRISRQCPSENTPGGFIYGDSVFYLGASHELACDSGTDSGKKLKTGHAGTIVGRRCEGDGSDDRYVAVLFAEHVRPMYMPPA